ncbi:MAG: PTS system mannose/fructose/sorbose family transporter subunit IID [Gemmatimonadales bacterium]|nr:PTS system mannose/fructose/sorbose family transporter subunit IID [Gemmatimonadales bacterium]
MTGRWRALLRLYAVQGTWNHERMLGIGMGYAAEPLLEDLKRVDPVRHSAAVVRSAEFFNCNPNLAGLALGATVRAEYESVPAPQLERLRTALCSPLGALGDQLFWTGLVPTLVGLTLAGIALGAGLWPVVALLVLYNILRLLTAVWSLRTGLDAGMRVAHALVTSWLPRAIRLIEPAAGLAVGLAVPLVAWWYLHGQPASAVGGTLAVAVVGAGVAQWSRLRLGGVRFGLIAIALTLLFRGVGL